MEIEQFNMTHLAIQANETLKELDLKWTDLALTSIATDATLN